MAATHAAVMVLHALHVWQHIQSKQMNRISRAFAVQLLCNGLKDDLMVFDGLTS